MKKITLLLPLALLFLASCGGVDSELVASGKSHQCNIQSITASLEEDPENAELQAELEKYVMFYESILNSAAEGGKSDLEAAIKKSLEEGCD